MTAVVTEVERKYETADGIAEFALTVLDRLPGTRGDPVVARHRLSAVYYDTANLALLDAGITLRRREGGDDAGWHLKLPSGRDTRTELRLPLADQVPNEFTSLLLASTRRAPLLPVARIDTDRQSRRWTSRSGHTIVDVVVDHVTGTDLREPGRTQHWTEAEVELGSGPHDLLDAIEAGLAELGLRRSRSASKLARLLGQPTRRPAALPNGPTAGDLVRAYLVAQVDAIVRHDVGVRRDVPDAVHSARVAIRRLRSTFRVFRAILDIKRTLPLGDELRWLGNQLGAARDAEVQRARFAQAPLSGPERDLLNEHFDRRQHDAKADAVAMLNSDRYLNLLDALDALVADPPFTELATRAADRVLPRLVRHAFAAVSRNLDDIQRVADRDAAVHRTRRAAKRARYAAELVRPLRPRRARRVVTATARFQDLIGEYQDSVVARQVLTVLVHEADRAGIPSCGYRHLHEREVAVADGIAPALRDEWHKIEHVAQPLFRSRH
jgi:CHAD domain-containing protein